VTRPACDMIIDHLLQLLEEPQQRDIAARLATSTELQAEAIEVREALASYNWQPASQIANPAWRTKLLAALDSSARFSPFVDDLARHFDLNALQVRALLARVDDPGSWTELTPGVAVIHFAGGSRAFAPHAGLVRMRRGLRYPAHRHLDPEMVYVLDGSILENDQRRFLPGDVMVNEATSVHDLTVSDHTHALLAVAQGGIEFVARPPDQK
jgi:hypothetical protein